MTRRRALGVVAMTLVVVLGTVPAASVGALVGPAAVGDGAAGQAAVDDGTVAQVAPGTTFVVEQGDQCLPVTPLSSDGENVTEFYDYRNPNTTPASNEYSSFMPQQLTDVQTSRLFLYEDPDGEVSMVVVHNELGAGPENLSAVTFRFAGLPSAGEWVVEDDEYQGRDDEFTRTEIDWVWGAQRTDGAAFAGLGGSTGLTIDPAFNEESDLWDTYGASVPITDWEVVTGSVENPETTALDPTANVTVRAGTCSSDSPPDASLSAPSSVTAGEQVTLDASGSTDDNGIDSYQWAFDDPSSIQRVTDEPTTTFTYEQPGTYQPTVNVVDAAGQNATATTTITVTAPDDNTTPTVSDYAVDNVNGSDEVGVSFNASETLATISVPITNESGATAGILDETSFTATENGGTVHYQSDLLEFADDTYTATLETAADAAGNDGATGQSGTVTVHTPPTARIDAPASVAANETLTVFGAGSSDDGLHGIESYEWEFGDGTTATGMTVEHSYDSPGSYTVELTVTDPAGNTDTANATVEVTDSGPDDTAPTISDYAVHNVDGSDEVSVTFNASETLANVSVPVTNGSGATAGSFDEDSFVANQRDGHVHYQSNFLELGDGTYTATLETAADAAGNDGAAGQSGTVTVHTPPTARIDAPDSVTTGQTFTVTGSPSSDQGLFGIESYEWSFDDGTTATGMTVEHSYDSAGTYTVALTATDPAGNTDTANATVTVESGGGDPGDTTPPTASFTAPSTVDVGEGLSVDASGSSDDTGIASYQWDFGDGSSASGQTAAHTYGSAGSYTITLTVTDGAGNTDSATRPVDVRTVDTDRPPTAAITGPSSPVEVGETFQLDASGSTDDEGVVKYWWDYTGDGHADRKTDMAVINTYIEDPSAAGTVTVTVWAIDASGQRDTASTDVTVVDPNDGGGDDPGDGGGDPGDGGGGSDPGDGGGGDDPGDGGGSGPGDGGGDPGDGGSGPGNGGSGPGNGGNGGNGNAGSGSSGAAGDGLGTPSSDETRVDLDQRGPTALFAEVDGQPGDPVLVPLPGVENGSSLGFGTLTVDLAQDNEFGLHVRTAASSPDGVAEPTVAREGFVGLAYLAVEDRAFEGWAMGETSVGFAVDGERLAETNATPEHVTAYRLDGGNWTALDTAMVDGPTLANESAVANATYEFAANTTRFGTYVVAVDRASFGVSEFEVSNTELTVGDTVEVTALVENSGRANGSYEAALGLDGETVRTRSVNVTTATPAALTFVLRPDSPGSYTVSLGDADATFGVDPAETTTTTTSTPTTTTATSTDAPDDTSTTQSTAAGTESTTPSGGQPGFGVAVALVALVAAALLAVRRRR